MKHYTPLSDSEHDLIWQKFKKEFSFSPGINESDLLPIKTGKPMHKISTESFWGDSYDHKIPEFLQRAINAFSTITPSGEKIFALDWQHPCYLVNPRELTVKDLVNSQPGKRIISFLPDDGYTIFMTQDFENVWVGNSSERNAMLIGTALINAFTKTNSDLNCI